MMCSMRYAVVLLLCMACQSVVAPTEQAPPAFVPVGAQSFSPGPEYARFWEHMEDCSGIRAPLARIVWAYVPGGGFSCPPGSCDGLWVYQHSVYLAHQRMDDSLLVEHEMLHDLLQVAGHPPVFASCDVGRSDP